MKSLKTIQTLSRMGKVLSTIVFVCCLVAFGGCLVGLVGLAAGFETIRLGGVSIKGIIRNTSGYSVGTLYAAMAAGMLLSAGEAVLAKFAAHYFDRELADGTPFTTDGARELWRLGILAIVLPLGTQTLAAIVHAVIARTVSDVAPLSFGNTGSVALGILFLVTAQICRYGAEISGQQGA